jgi:hypothetical protein
MKAFPNKEFTEGSIPLKLRALLPATLARRSL